MKAHAIQIAKTAALCVSLGLGLFFVFETVALTSARNTVALWLALVLSLALAVLSIPAFLKAWRSGVLPSKIGRVERESQPGWYWSLMTLDAAANACLLALAGYCALRLLAS